MIVELLKEEEYDDSDSPLADTDRWGVKRMDGLGDSEWKVDFISQRMELVSETCNNDKNYSEIQLEHETEKNFSGVCGEEVHECRPIGWNITLGGREGELFWEGGDDFRVDGLRFHTCLTDILGFLEKLEWWFEQDIDKEEVVRFEGDEDGDEV
ncbi:hypothetical protein Tco_0266607 [Tanacetum coccineum]